MEYLEKIRDLSEWVIVVYCQLSNFSAISWQDQVNFQWGDDEVHFILDQHAKVIIFWLENGKFEFSQKQYIFLEHSKREFCAEFYYHF
jgi:hypothetical protein